MRRATALFPILAAGFSLQAAPAGPATPAPATVPAPKAAPKPAPKPAEPKTAPKPAPATLPAAAPVKPPPEDAYLQMEMLTRAMEMVRPNYVEESKVTDEELQLFRAYLKSEAQDHLWERAEQVLGRGVYQAAPTGCKHCQRSGYLGEMPVNEVLPVNREVRDLFSASESRLDFNGISRYRLNTLSEAALELVERGDTEFESLFI